MSWTYTYLNHRVHSLCKHEVVLNWVLRNLLWASEHSLVEHKLTVSPSQSCRVARLVRDCGVLGHGHRGALVSLPLCQHICNVLKPLDEMFPLRIHLHGRSKGGL